MKNIDWHYKPMQSYKILIYRSESIATKSLSIQYLKYRNLFIERLKE